MPQKEIKLPPLVKEYKRVNLALSSAESLTLSCSCSFAEGDSSGVWKISLKPELGAGGFTVEEGSEFTYLVNLDNLTVSKDIIKIGHDGSLTGGAKARLSAFCNYLSCPEFLSSMVSLAYNTCAFEALEIDLLDHVAHEFDMVVLRGRPADTLPLSFDCDSTFIDLS